MFGWFKKTYRVLRGGQPLRSYDNVEDAAFYVHKFPDDKTIDRNGVRIWVEGHEKGLSLGKDFTEALGVIRRRIARLNGWKG